MKDADADQMVTTGEVSFMARAVDPHLNHAVASASAHGGVFGGTVATDTMAADDLDSFREKIMAKSVNTFGHVFGVPSGNGGHDGIHLQISKSL